MDLKKHIEFFNPDSYINEEIHIIGVGAVGSQLAEILTRIGFEELYLYDFDVVDAHNITNQAYFETQIGQSKLEALTNTCTQINSRFKPKLKIEGWQPGARLSGHIMLAVDNIDTRRAIVKENLHNTNIISFSDYRMGLTNAQHYFSPWDNPKLKENFLASMQFTREEAKEATPVSACGTTLSVLPTIRTLTAAGIANWMNFVKDNNFKKVIMTDSFQFRTEAY